jgi:hypothetical protein
MNKLFLSIILFTCVSCISDDRNTDVLTIHASSKTGGDTIFVVPSSNGVSTDSLVLELPQDSSQVTYNWKPELEEGSFVFGVIGREDLRDTVGYFTNGVITPGSSEYVVTVYQERLDILEILTDNEQ